MLAIHLHVAPSVLMKEDPQMLATLIELLNEAS